MTVYGFIGLGHQGTPMAERMIAAGLQPWLWARRPDVLERYQYTDSHQAASPAELGAKCDVIGLCLYDARATDAVLSGPDGLLGEIRPGTVLAIHATVGPDYVIDLAQRVSSRGVQVVDAPVSGGDAAAQGQLLVMVGGEETPCAACEPMLTAYAKTVVRLGGLGTAQTTKLLNNALMTAITGMVFDVFDIGRRLGINEKGLGAVLAGGSAANPSIGHYLALGGAGELSIRAWPTLHKDVALLHDLLAGSALANGPLATVAADTVEVMQRHRNDR